MDDEKLLAGRLNDLSKRAQQRDSYAYSEFLTLYEQSLLNSMRFETDVGTWGGFDSAERRIACFKGRDCIYQEDPPVVCICVTPVSRKYADELSHRDFLGSLIGLGLRRELIGDIILSENTGYVFCLDSISDFIISELKKIRHTDVICKIVKEMPTSAGTDPGISRIVISSERLDAVISAVYKISRSESQKLFGIGKVFINGSVKECFTDSPKSGDIVSVRGIGRFIYEGVASETKKGRLSALVRVFK